MNSKEYGGSQILEAFIKSAQYIARLKTQQDIWNHLGKLLVTYFPAEWVAFAQADADGGILVHHCTPGVPFAASDLPVDLRDLVVDVIESGFLACFPVTGPPASMTVFLPIFEQYHPEQVMLIGHGNADPLPNDLLNTYLAVAGLAGTALERLHTEQELSQHQDYLEELVKERTAELAKETTRSQLILRSVGEGICGIDPDGNITFLNPFAAELIGWAPDELIGRNAHETFHHSLTCGNPYPEADCPVLATLRTGKAHSATNDCFIRKDGTYFRVEFTTAPIIEGGQPVGAVMVFRDITERLAAIQAIEELNRDLERRVSERTAELARTVESLREEVDRRTTAEEILRERTRQLRALASELTLAEQRERQRLAHVLHDGLQQLLVGAKLRVAALESAIEDQKIRAQVKQISSLLTESIEASRSLTAELYPPVLHHGGLIPALEWLAKWMQQQHGLNVCFSTDGPIDSPPNDLTILLFQAARELLFNVVKHAGVSTASVRIKQVNNRIEVTVADDGVGFDASQFETKPSRSAGFGLFSVQERLAVVGGEMEIQSAPGKGSRFILRVSLPAVASSNLE